MSENEQQTPSIVIVAALFVLVGAFGWAFMAAQYAHTEGGWRTQGVQELDADRSGSIRSRGFASDPLRPLIDHVPVTPTDTDLEFHFFDFVQNAFRQLAKFPAVISFNFKSRLWLIGLILLAEAGVVGIGLWMRSLERQWAKRRFQNR